MVEDYYLKFLAHLYTIPEVNSCHVERVGYKFEVALSHQTTNPVFQKISEILRA